MASVNTSNYLGTGFTVIWYMTNFTTGSIPNNACQEPAAPPAATQPPQPED